MTDGLPSISAICLTYGRPALLEEAIYSFLQQDYAGRKELLVLNDFAAQTLSFAHPEVRIINLPIRFRTVGEKMNAAAALCSHDLLFVWDDDDLYLPWRISLSVRHFDAARGFFSPGQAWSWDQGTEMVLTRNVYHSGSCIARTFFDEVGGYAAMGNGYDQEIEQRIAVARPGSTECFLIQPADVYYIYRWQITGAYHMSGYAQDRPGENIEQHAVADRVQDDVRRGLLPTGEIDLRPCWRADYLKLVRKHLAQHRG